MKPPSFARALTTAERRQLQSGLRSADAFTVRRCQILLASAEGLAPPQIARNLACAVGTVHYALRAFAREGLACLQAKSSRPHSVHPCLDQQHTDALKDLLHHSPRLFGQPTSFWTLSRVAHVCHAKGWTPRRLSGEAIRQALKRLGIRWRRAKHWITSPDPSYTRKKRPRSLNSAGAAPSGLGAGLPG
jgi:transposase